MVEVSDQNRAKNNSVIAMEKIKELIFSGELSADSNHLESELADRLGMSRTPVREATLMLEAHGLLEVRPRKGVRIKAISAQDMFEIYEVLTELESLAAKRAAEFGYTKDDLSALFDCILRMEKALEERNLDAWAEADEDFHTELVTLGKNERLKDIVMSFNDQVRRARSVTLRIRPLPTRSNKDHRDVYEAILQGDGERAQEIHQGHRTGARDMLTQLLENNGLRRI